MQPMEMGKDLVPCISGASGLTPKSNKIHDGNATGARYQVHRLATLLYHNTLFASERSLSEM